MNLFSPVAVIAVFLGVSLAGHASEPTTCGVDVSQSSVSTAKLLPLPGRDEPRIQTTGRVPHIQTGLTPVADVNNEIRRFVFSLPGVEKRPTIVSLPGATGMWLHEDIRVAQPTAIVAGREFAHIHPDGSFHAPLPFKRAVELNEKGWGEHHPWANSRDGWEGFVMIYSARSFEEMKTVLQLVTESYNYVTGLNIKTDC